MTVLTVTREKVEDFLYAEADLLDDWQLEEWLQLFDEEHGSYSMPSTDTPDATDPAVTLFLIADDMRMLRSRVKQLLSGTNWAENPPSRTRRLITNVRIHGEENGVLQVTANFVVFRMRFQNVDNYIGKYHYELLDRGGDFKILKRHVVLDLEALRPHGKVSFIV